MLQMALKYAEHNPSDNPKVLSDAIEDNNVAYGLVLCQDLAQVKMR